MSGNLILNYARMVSDFIHLFFQTNSLSTHTPNVKQVVGIETQIWIIIFLVIFLYYSLYQGKQNHWDRMGADSHKVNSLSQLSRIINQYESFSWKCHQSHVCHLVQWEVLWDSLSQAFQVCPCFSHEQAVRLLQKSTILLHNYSTPNYVGLYFK